MDNHTFMRFVGDVLDSNFCSHDKIFSLDCYKLIRAKRLKNIKHAVVCKYKKQSSGGVLSNSLTQVFSCEFYKISKNTFFQRTPPVAASEVLLEKYCRKKIIQIK